MRRGWPAVLLVLAAAAIWQLFPRGDPERPGDAIPQEAPDGNLNREGPSLEGASPQGAGHADAGGAHGTGAIFGVVHLDGAPAGATVEALWVGPAQPDRVGTGRLGASLTGRGPTATARGTSAAGPDGTFAFEGLPTGAYLLRAATANGARGTARVVLPPGSARVAARIDARGGGIVLRGRVVDGKGAPLPGWVAVAPDGTEIGTAAFLSIPADALPLDAEGRFTVEGLEPGGSTVIAFGRGFHAMRSVDLPLDGEYVLTIGAGHEVRGRVMDATTRAGIAGATVLGGGWQESVGFDVRSASTDEQGRFTLSTASRPSALRGHFVLVHAQGYSPVRSPLHAGDPAGFLVTLVPTGAVRGLVRDAAGTPVAGVEICATPRESAQDLDPAHGARTDREGRFKISDLRAGEWRVYALDRAWSSPEVAEAPSRGFDPLAVWVRSGETAEVELQVVPAGTVTGRISSGGAPVAGAFLELVQRPQLYLDEWRMAKRAPVATAASDASGAFRLEGVVPGLEARVRARAPGLADASSNAFRVASGETANVEIAFPPPRWLDLLVTSGADGAPVAHARIGTGELGTWTTDTTGRARVGPLPSGPISLWASARGFADLWERDEVPGSRGDALLLTHTLVLEVAHALGGTVLAPEGLGAASVVVRVKSRSGMHSWTWSRDTLDARSRWRVEGLGAGTYTITATAQVQGTTWTAEAEAEAGSEDVMLSLAPEPAGAAAGRLRIRVLDPDGAVVPTASVTVWAFRPGRQEGTTGSLQDGLYETTRPHPEADVWIEVGGLPAGRGGARVLGPLRDLAEELVIRLTAASPIAGHVVDAAGAGVRGVRVEAHVASSRSGRDMAGRVAMESTLTGPDGGFALEGLGEGTWVLVFTVPPRYLVPEPISVTAGQAGIRVSLVSGVLRRLVVLDPEGAPVVGASVSWQTAGDKSSKRGHARTGPSGAASLAHLDAQVPLALHVEAPQERRDVFPLDLEAWLPRDETLTLRAALLLAGVVVDPTGRPVPEATVMHQTARKAPGGWSGTRTDAEGRFEFGPLEPGPVSVYAEVGQAGTGLRAPGMPGEEPEGVLRTQAGNRAVRLVVDPGLSIKVRVQGAEHEFYASAVVRIRRGTDVEMQTHTIMDGRLVLRSLRSEDRCSIWFGLEDGRFAVARDLAPQTNEVVLRLERGLPVTGRLRLPGGRLPKHGTVTVDVLEDAGPSGEVDAEGRFRIEGIPAGIWPVRATAFDTSDPRHSVRYVGVGQVTAGGNVEISLEPAR